MPEFRTITDPEIRSQLRPGGDLEYFDLSYAYLPGIHL